MSAVAPGVQVNVTGDRARRGIASRTGRLIVPAITYRGRVDEPVLIRSFANFRERFGTADWTSADEHLRAAFNEGVGEAIISRVVGPAAANATVDLLADDGTTTVLTIDARDPGAHGNDLSVEVLNVTADTYDFRVSFEGELEEEFVGVTSNTALVDHLDSSRWVRGTVVDPTFPAAATSDLTGGDDDRANITDTEWQAALDRISVDWGPGQVTIPSRTAAAAWDMIEAHASNRNRVALIDPPVDTSVAQLESLASGRNSSYEMFIGNWFRVPADTPTGTRAVEGSAIAAGLIARRDAVSPTAHEAAAGEQGVTRHAVEIIGEVESESDRATLNGAGVVLAKAGRTLAPRLYGFRSTSDQDAWVQFTAGRYRMSLIDRLDQLGERYVFRTLTPEVIQDFGNDIRAMLKQDFEAGALFGEDPSDAYSVNTGDDVNTADTLADGELRAHVVVSMSPFGERVVIDVVKVATGQVV